MPSRRRFLAGAATAVVASLAGCNAGVFEPRVRQPVSASATIPPDGHRAWRFELARDRDGRLALEKNAGDAPVTTITPAQYEAYAAEEPIPDAGREAVALWHDDEAYVTQSEIEAGEWVLLCENTGDGPARVTVRVSVDVWAVDLRE